MRDTRLIGDLHVLEGLLNSPPDAHDFSDATSAAHNDAANDENSSHQSRCALDSSCNSRELNTLSEPAPFDPAIQRYNGAAGAHASAQQLDGLLEGRVPGHGSAIKIVGGAVPCSAASVRRSARRGRGTVAC